MHRYIGIDAHTESCTVAVMGPSGKRLREARLETNGKVLTDFVRSLAGRKHICLEEGTQAEWLYEMLEPLADEVVVQLPERSDGVKNDSVDAWTRGLNRNRNPILKRVFAGAAESIIRRGTRQPLRQGYQRQLDAGTKPNLARLTLTRRIAGAVLAMWKNQEEYDPAKQQ